LPLRSAAWVETVVAAHLTSREMGEFMRKADEAGAEASPRRIANSLITAQAPLDVFEPESVLYGTRLGAQIVGDSMDLLALLPEESVDLIVTSPPFALLRKKSYGNEEQSAYVQWLAGFGKAALRVLKPTGSLVLDLGHAYQRGRPVRSLYNYRVLLSFVDELGYHLAQEFFWHNPAKLPSPIEWVNKRKIRVKDSVNTVWWLSKTEYPKADVRKVLGPYSPRMEQLLKGAESFYAPGVRPSGHDIGTAFGRNNGGAIPPNLLTLPNTESNSYYLRTCKQLELRSHPARFPAGLPRFFVQMLTEPGDLVLDIFSGSNTTGHVAELADRRWLAFELDRDFAALSALRFLEGEDLDAVQAVLETMNRGTTARLHDRGHAGQPAEEPSSWISPSE
jgi:site-specific DNA-methyltransferase (cytosine-N4-specific)